MDVRVDNRTAPHESNDHNDYGVRSYILAHTYDTGTKDTHTDVDIHTNANPSASTPTLREDMCNMDSMRYKRELGVPVTSSWPGCFPGGLLCQYLLSMVVRSKVSEPLTAHPLFQIFAKTPTGKTITLDIDPSDTIEHIKLLVRDKSYIPVHEQRLTLEGKQLEDGHTARECGIVSESQLRVCLGGGGGAPKKDKNVDPDRTLFLTGALHCLDLDLEEQIERVCGKGTCRLHPMWSEDNRKCVLTTAIAYQKLKKMKNIEMMTRKGVRTVRIRLWDPPGHATSSTATAAPSPGEQRVRSTQTMVSNHAMRVIIGQMKRACHGLEQVKRSVEILEGAWGAELYPEQLSSVYTSEDEETCSAPPGLPLPEATADLQHSASSPASPAPAISSETPPCPPAPASWTEPPPPESIPCPMSMPRRMPARPCKATPAEGRL